MQQVHRRHLKAGSTIPVARRMEVRQVLQAAVEVRQLCLHMSEAAHDSRHRAKLYGGIGWLRKKQVCQASPVSGSL